MTNSSLPPSIYRSSDFYEAYVCYLENPESGIDDKPYAFERLPIVEGTME